MLSKEFIDEMKQKLHDTKIKLEDDLKGFSSHVELGDSLDDNAEEVAIDEASRSIISRIKSDLEKIDKALQKIDAGKYGVDDEGKDISEERLRVLPWADKAI